MTETGVAPSYASANSLPHINNTNIALPAAISASLTAYDCTNNPGPQITFSGLTVLGGLGVQTVFTNNINQFTHTHVADATINLAAFDAGEEIVIPKQPVLGGVGGNPFIWVQFINGDGSAASGEIFLGRCVQGAGWKVTGPGATTASAWGTYAIAGCENSPGPNITFNGGMVLGGLKARIIFRNNDNPVGGPHEASVARDIVMIGAGTPYTFPKQPVLGGVGGNPWILAGFTDTEANLYDDLTLMGRCEQLSKALN